MTDRHAGYVVTLKDSIREDDAEHTINAIRMVKGVVSVQPVIDDISVHLAQSRVDTEWMARIGELLKPWRRT